MPITLTSSNATTSKELAQATKCLRWLNIIAVFVNIGILIYLFSLSLVPIIHCLYSFIYFILPIDTRIQSKVFNFWFALIMFLSYVGLSAYVIISQILSNQSVDNFEIFGSNVDNSIGWKCVLLSAFCLQPLFFFIYTSLIKNNKQV